MIHTPKIIEVPAQLTAVIRLVIPRSEIRNAMGPAIRELMGVLAAQGVAPAGPIFSRHFRMHPETFDFEVGTPVQASVEAAGRVEPGELPGGFVVRASYPGAYENLGAAWGELDAWINTNGLKPDEERWESYVAGPDASPDPDRWITELNRPLAGYSAATP